MKKIISHILLICMILSLFTFESVMAENGLTERQTMILNATGVLNDEYSFDAKVTKAQFAQMIAKVYYGDMDLDMFDVSQPLPKDVDEYSDYANAVKLLHSKGFLPVDNFGRFFPEKSITANEAISIVLRAMGYTEKYIKVLAGSDNAFAMMNELTEGMTTLEGEELNVYSAYNLIYNMLYFDISDLYEDVNSELLFMSESLNLYEVKGVIDDDGVISLDGATNHSSDYIAIDGEPFINECGYNNLFGQSVYGIYKYDRKQNEKTLICVCENVRKNNLTTILSYDITRLDNRTYYYYEDSVSSKTKSIHVPTDAVIIYNEKPLGLYDNFEDSMLLPENGRLRFYDNDNDGNVDILRVESFDTGIVKSVDTEKEKIYVNGSRIIDLEGRDAIIEYQDGTLIELGSVIKDNTVLYAESLDGSIVKLVVSNELYSDKVTGINNSDATTVSTEKGANYAFSKYALDNCGEIEVGQFYKFYMNAFGRVAYWEKDIMPNEYTYGCIAKIISPEDMEPEDYTVRIFTQYGESERYKLAKKVLIIEEDGTEKYLKRDELPAQLTYRGVVRFKLNANRELNSIELPYTKGNRPDQDDRLYYIVDSYTNSNGSDYFTNVSEGQVNYGGATIIDSDTVVFHCPTDPADIDNYKIGGTSSFAQYGTYNIYAFGTDPKKLKAECVCMYTTFSSTITSEYPLIVKDVSLVYNEDEGEVLYRIILARGTSEVAYYMRQEVYENEVYATANGVTTPIKISVGDIIYYAANDNYVIEKATVIYDADQTVQDEKGNDIIGAIAGTQISYFDESNLLGNPFFIANRNQQNAGSASAWKYYQEGYKILTGWIYSVEGEYIQITTQNPAYGYDPNKTISDGFITQIYGHGLERFFSTTEVLGDNKFKVRAGNLSDLKSYLDYGADCSRVVWVQYLYANRFLNIIVE